MLALDNSPPLKPPAMTTDLTLEQKAAIVAINEYHEEMNRHMQSLAAELGVSVECATDVWYLRTRSRHTPELEAELIALHAAGTPPNMCEFGSTPETQLRLYNESRLDAHNKSHGD